MGKEAITPGYVWTEIPRDVLLNGSVPPLDSLPSEDLKTRHPVPSVEILQTTWDTRRENVAAAVHSDLHIPYTVFNEASEAGQILWLPGWGVSLNTPGGALSATALAALNPNHRVIVPEEAEKVSNSVKQSARQGNLIPYAQGYMLVTDQESGTTAIAGHSRGGVIAAYLTRELKPTTLSIQDTPLSPIATALPFALNVGLRDNLVSGKQTRLADTHEEELLREAQINSDEANHGTVDMAKQYLRQTWLINGLAKTSLLTTVKLAALGGTRVFWSHGQRNAGMPVHQVRKGMIELYRNGGSNLRLRYFESNTGHYAIGHTARFGRFVRFAIEESQKS